MEDSSTGNCSINFARLLYVTRGWWRVSERLGGSAMIFQDLDLGKPSRPKLS
jgi:hypothetical protein